MFNADTFAIFLENMVQFARDQGNNQNDIAAVLKRQYQALNPGADIEAPIEEEQAPTPIPINVNPVLTNVLPQLDESKAPPVINTLEGQTEATRTNTPYIQPAAGHDEPIQMGSPPEGQKIPEENKLQEVSEKEGDTPPNGAVPLAKNANQGFPPPEGSESAGAKTDEENK